MNWKNAQDFEINWHNNNPFIYREQVKQEVYALKIGLVLDYQDYDLKGQRIIDIGSGDCSMLLKYKNHNSVAIDPLMNKFPKWVKQRYKESGIEPMVAKGEELDLKGFDEAWIYNCLQHTQDPELVIKNVKKSAKIVRVFEWIDMPISEGHIHTLKEDKLNDWLKGKGKTEVVNDRGCRGRCYYGVFI
jgi:2-polyprenyl-3-methyl-5-hydroxy-6-metoxy-1,4-benzoquinol methylase